MKPQGNLDQTAIQRFRYEINRPHIDHYIWAELWPDVKDFDTDPTPCPHAGCAICEDCW